MGSSAPVRPRPLLFESRIEPPRSGDVPCPLSEATVESVCLNIFVPVHHLFSVEHLCSSAPCIFRETTVAPVATVWFQCPVRSVLKGGALSAVEISCSERAIVHFEVAVVSGVTSWNRAAVCVVPVLARYVLRASK